MSEGTKNSSYCGVAMFEKSKSKSESSSFPKVKGCPAPGQGVHHWVLHVACTFTKAGISEGKISEYCEEKATRTLQPNEVENAVGSYKNRRKRKSRPSIKLDQKLIKKIQRTGPSLLKLENISPVKTPCKLSAGRYVDILFPDNCLICCGASSHTFTTRPKNELFDKLDRLQFIVPSPMSSKLGFTQSGKPSSHTLSNTGDRRFLVVEFDDGTLDEQAAILQHLGTKFPLTLVVFSGSKSLHGWFYVEGLKEYQIKEFFNYSCKLGCDPATWTKSQFVRIPNGKRKSGERQTVHYFNPNTIK